MTGCGCGDSVKFDGLSAAYKRALWAVIAINGVMFLVEIGAGMLAASGVWATNTPWPDLIIAGIMASLFLWSSTQIVRQALAELRVSPILSGAQG